VPFTIGCQPNDDVLLREPRVMKLGAHEDYEGGWVWATKEQAALFIRNSSLSFPVAVYELELTGTWETDVSPEPSSDGAHRILRDARIVQRVS